MKQVTAVWVVAIAALASPGALTAHHSLVQFDTTMPTWVKGTVVRFDPINPHVRFVLDETREDGRTERWVVDGPAGNNIARMGLGPDFLKAGDVVEVCGFVLKEDAARRGPADAAARPATRPGRPLSGHLLVMPNGKRRYWSDYGVLDKCLDPGEEKEALRREAFGR